MNTHLPECDLSYDCDLPHVQSYCHQCEMYCVCDRLNACTARVRAACIAAVEALRDPERFPAVTLDGTPFPEIVGVSEVLAALRAVQP